MLNPYQAPTDAPSGFAKPKHFILHPAFAICWIALRFALATSLISILDAVWPLPLADRALYFRVYASIGAIAGLLSWFTARLVALSRLKFSTLVFLLTPFAFVFLVALVSNRMVAGVTLIIVGKTLALAWLARTSKSAYIQTERGIDEAADPLESPS